MGEDFGKLNAALADIKMQTRGVLAAPKQSLSDLRERIRSARDKDGLYTR